MTAPPGADRVGAVVLRASLTGVSVGGYVLDPWCGTPGRVSPGKPGRAA